VDAGIVPRQRSKTQSTVIVAVLLEDLRIQTIKLARITVDGTDALRVLSSLLKELHYDAVLLSSISFGGFNLVDIKRLSHATHRPVIAVTGERPNNAAVRNALRKHFDDWEERWGIVKNAGQLYSCKPLPKEPRLYFEAQGGSATFAKKIILSSAVISRLPEPIRVAGLLARGLSPLYA
jgi:endonuclease V-like protein UPF0215 family